MRSISKLRSDASEASILGGILLRNEVLSELPDLEPCTFFDPRNAVAFESMRNLEAQGRAIDIVTLEDDLAKRGKLEAIGGVAFLGELALRVPTPDNVIDYAAEVQRLAAKRRLAVLLSEATDEALALDTDAADVAARTAARLAPVASPNRGEARVVTMSDVEPEHVEWLWFGRIPRGMMTLIDGDPGVGKSTITIDLAARISRGEAMPLAAGPGAPAADVVLIGSEDNLGATVRPRLDAAGADCRRVHVIEATPRRGDPDAPPTLADVAAIEQVVAERRAAMLVIDPVMAHLPPDVDSYRDADVRRVLAPWSKMAERTKVAIVIVRHLRKGGGSALYRGGGSIGIIGAARSGLLVARDHEDPATCVVAQSKGNLAPASDSLRYRVVDRDGVGVIEWLAVAEGVSADDIAAPPEDANVRGKDLDAAVTALREVLAEGPQLGVVVERDVRAYVGCSERTVRRARERLGIVPVPRRSADGRKIGGWIWALPGQHHGGGQVEDVDSAKTAEQLDIDLHGQGGHHLHGHEGLDR